MRAYFTLFLLLLAPVLPTNADQGVLLAASSGEHLWIMRSANEEGDQYELLHHALDMGGPYAATTISHYGRPEAIAALGDRVWIVSQSDGSWRGVSTLRIRKRPEIDLYVHEPETRFAVLDPLPGEGALVGFTVTASGPVALVRTGEVSSERGDSTPQGTYRLLELRGDRWIASTLPDGIANAPVALGVDGSDFSRLNLLVADRNNPERAMFHRRVDGSWTQLAQYVDLDVRAVRSLTTVRGRLAVVLQHQPGQRETTYRVPHDAQAHIEIAYVRPGSVLPLAYIATANPQWTAVGMDDGVKLIEQDRNRGLSMRTIHWMTGDVGEPALVSRPPLPTGRLWHVAVMLTITVVAVVLVLVVRPGTALAGEETRKRTSTADKGTLTGEDAALVALPKGTVVFPAMLRLIALLIDLVPGGILAVLILRVPPIDLLRLPIVTNSLEQAAPYLVMIGMMFVHVTLTELAKATSLGKALMGGRVMSQVGGKPSARQVLIRNTLKLLILMVPPLAIFAMLSRHLQGFNDILAKTVVVGDLAEPNEDNASDAGE